MTDKKILKFPAPANSNPSKAVETPENHTHVQREDAKVAQLQALDDLRALVESDKISSFALVGLSDTGAILTEVCPAQTRRYDYPATFLGALRVLEDELVEVARSMPQMLNDGTIVSHSDLTVI